MCLIYTGTKLNYALLILHDINDMAPFFTFAEQLQKTHDCFEKIEVTAISNALA